MGAYVYMLACSDGSFYVGSATGDDLWSEHFLQITDAIAAERQIKGWSRAKKIALAKGEWRRVQSLAKRRGGPPARKNDVSS